MAISTWVALIAICLAATRLKLTLPWPYNHLAVAQLSGSQVPIAKPISELPTDTRLQQSRQLWKGCVDAVETAAVDQDGLWYLPDKSGKIWTARENDTEPKLWADVGGRPLGAAVDQRGNLVLCEPSKGLVMVERDSKRVVVLASRVSTDSPLGPGSDILYADDLAIAANGTIYFSDASDVWPMWQPAAHTVDVLGASVLDLCQGTRKGRIIKYDPGTKKAYVLAENLSFPNGVALAADESFLAFSETWGLRVSRLWLTGEQAGSVEMMVPSLPALPDGMAPSSDGNFWLAFAARVPGIVPAAARFRITRWLLARVPPWMHPPVQLHGLLIKVSPTGTVLQTFQDPAAETVRSITGVVEHNGKLILTSLLSDYIAVLDLEKP